MTETRTHAVVLGASMAGLLSARVLSDHFERVTLVERDVMPEGAGARKGVPQGNHAHGLLASGYRVMDACFPGMMDDLEAAGAPRGDSVGNFLWYQYGGWKLRHDAGLGGIVVSRPCLEAAIRSRVKSIPNVRFREGADFEQPIFDPAAGRVTAVPVNDRATGSRESVAADLVVDASGRGSQSARWLETWGFEPPPTTLVKVDVGYATRVFERKPGEFRNSMGAIIAGTPPGSRRVAGVLAAEGPRWVVTLAGLVGDHPPADESGWLEFAKSLPVPDVYELVTSNRPLSEIITHKFPANQRRHYEKLKRFPGGYLVIGDAICSFNPIYGQGMSVAAMEAKALDRCLATGDSGLAGRFFKEASRVADIPWLIATGEDFRFPEVEGKRPPLHGFVSRYLERVHRVATYDPAVCRGFMEVVNLLVPPASLMKPAMMRRVLFSRPPGTMTAAAAGRGEETAA